MKRLRVEFKRFRLDFEIFFLIGESENGWTERGGKRKKREFYVIKINVKDRYIYLPLFSIFDIFIYPEILFFS